MFPKTLLYPLVTRSPIRLRHLPPLTGEGWDSKSFPVEEKYSLTDQIRRSSRSVGANIAEAWKKRRYKAHFISKLTDADAEASETQQPHIHAKYGEFEAAIGIADGEILAGDMPKKQLRLVQAWIELRRDELFADWELAINGENPYKIEPL